MTTALKQRIVGAIFILSLGVILIPVILDKPQQGLEQETIAHEIPDAPPLPDVSDVSKIHYVFDDTITQAAPKIPQPVLVPSAVAVAEPAVETPAVPVSDSVVSEEVPVIASGRPPAPSLAAMETVLPSDSDAPEPTAPIAAPKPAPVSPSQGHAKASASLAMASQSQWTIQLGAFSSEQNAKALVQKLSQGGFNPYLRAITQDSLVRVYVSPGIPREQAVDLASKLDAEYGLKGIVVRYFQ